MTFLDSLAQILPHYPRLSHESIEGDLSILYQPSNTAHEPIEIYFLYPSEIDPDIAFQIDLLIADLAYQLKLSLPIEAAKKECHDYLIQTKAILDEKHQLEAATEATDKPGKAKAKKI